MRSPGVAIAWEFGRRLRLGLIALALYALVVAAVMLLLGRPFSVERSGEDFAALVAVPVATTFMFFLGVFSFGFAGDLAARESIYPARMFTLPVTTRALAGWPMFYGAAGMMLLFLGASLFLRWETGGGLVRFRLKPWGIEVPLLWPALLGAVFLGWTQALTWMPYGWRGLRMVVTVLWLISLDAIVFLAVEYEVPEPRLIAFLAPQLPLAYLAACFAVARARRSDVPDWRGLSARLSRAFDVIPRRRDHFPSAARAQAWFEWRRHGWSLPMWVGLLLPFELALLFVLPELVVYILLGVLLTPPFMASFIAATVGESNPSARDSYGVSPFLATRPMTSVALIAAKLKATIGSTLLAWLLVLVAIPSALVWSGTASAVIERVSRGVETIGTPRVVVLLLLGWLGLMASTWKQLVQSLYIGLSGREWLIKSSVLLVLSFLVVIWPIGRWIHDDPQVQAALLNALPWILAVLVCVKVSAAAWIATRLYDGRLLSDRTLVTGAACWLVAVLALYGLLVWLAAPLVVRYFALLVAILEIPLARLSAAPLALAWNRHR
jgi:hypothetical protein